MPILLQLWLFQTMLFSITEICERITGTNGTRKGRNVFIVVLSLRTPPSCLSYIQIEVVWHCLRQPKSEVPISKENMPFVQNCIWLKYSVYSLKFFNSMSKYPFAKWWIFPSSHDPLHQILDVQFIFLTFSPNLIFLVSLMCKDFSYLFLPKLPLCNKN